MRHGDAVPEIMDAARPLSERGEREVERIVEQLKSQNVRVDAFLHSSKRRAQQTAEMVKKYLNSPGELMSKENLGPNDDPAYIFEELNKYVSDVMIVSHMPFLPNLLSRLMPDAAMGGAGRFQTGSVAALEKTDGQWSLLWVMSPE
jgi:phosphohistidine phosphatase